MSVTFHLIGSSFIPRVNGPGGPGYAWRSYAAPLETVTANAGAIGGYVLDFSKSAYTSYSSSYNGVGNWPDSLAFSLNMRVAIIGMADTLTRALLYCGGGGRPENDSFSIWIDPTNITIRMVNFIGQVGVNSVGFAHGGVTDGTFYDFGFTGTGNTTSNGFKAYKDGSLLGQTTSSRTWNNPHFPPPTDRIGLHRDLHVGFASNNVSNTRFLLDELYIDNTILDFTANQALVGGAAPLNGASRTAYFDTTPYDGSIGSGGGTCLVARGPGSVGFR